MAFSTFAVLCAGRMTIARCTPGILWQQHNTGKILPSIGLYFLTTRLFKFEFAELPGGRDYIAARIDELGPMSTAEKCASFIMALTILLWATDKVNHVEASAISVL